MNNVIAPIVTTTAGDVRGVRRDGDAAFLGIPYAAAPVGALRFAAPRAPNPWAGVRDATRPGATPQRRLLGLEPSFPEPTVPGHETLNLNVFTPAAGEPDRRLPVMVWIHGGGFAAGSQASPWYDGRSFSRDGVVVVTISYRLGFHGYGWIADAPMNRGVLDQIAALEWVRDNIAAFGGDPAAVTIAGQSAGAISVMTLFTIPLAQSLFRSAICMSGADRIQSLAEAEHVGRALAVAAGAEPTVAGWSALTEDQVLDAQDAFGIATPPDEIDPAAFVRSALMPPGDQGMPFGPVIDGDLLTRSVGDALAGGVAADKDLLMGVTAHEFTLWMLHAEEHLRGVDVVEAMVEEGLPRELARDYVASHPELPSAAALLGQLIGIRGFRQSMMRWADLRAKTSPDLTWLYDFRWPSPFYSDLGVHCVELPFAWDLLDADGVARTHGPHPPRELAKVTHAAWVAFVTEGDPGWRPWTGGVGMVFNETSREQPILGIERRLADAAAVVWPETKIGRDGARESGSS
ncbi:carboxylesterase/lipase family protein [Actinomycetospora flava]|uniref:Carboxylic ester hydrolase n=1 Tax=Actinomycetospora flava TaxID=3129232 RepID=A0ABU8M485_9PSEU